jgi:hypothetical protein
MEIWSIDGFRLAAFLVHIQHGPNFSDNCISKNVTAAECAMRLIITVCSSGFQLICPSQVEF